MDSLCQVNNRPIWLLTHTKRNQGIFGNFPKSPPLPSPRQFTGFLVNSLFLKTLELTIMLSIL